jgi:hypothetical protein
LQDEESWEAFKSLCRDLLTADQRAHKMNRFGSQALGRVLGRKVV